MVLQRVLVSLLFILCFEQADASKVVNFKTREISIGKKHLRVWIADTEKKRSQGMMFKTEWPAKIEGMLFIFENEARRSFWMKNTILPLSLAYFDKSGRLFEKADLSPPKSLAQINVDRSTSSKAAKYVIEVPQKWFQKEGVKVGAKLRLL